MVVAAPSRRHPPPPRVARVEGAALTDRQRRVMEFRHPPIGPPLIFERVAVAMHTSYQKVLVEYSRAKAVLGRLKILERHKPLSPQARDDVDRFGRYVW